MRDSNEKEVIPTNLPAIESPEVKSVETLHEDGHQDALVKPTGVGCKAVVGIPDVGFKKISANETDYGTGAKRDARGGKGALKWMPHDALFLVSRIYENGNLGRGWRNWELGMPLEDLIDSGLRHATAYLSGDRSEPHLPQAIWNLTNALQMSIWIWQGLRPQELNNLPDHRHFWYPGDPSPCPLSPTEIEWLKIRGITQDLQLSEQYLAGIVDGEGTISISKKSGKFYAYIRVYNNSRPLLERLQKRFGGGSITDSREATETHAASFTLEWSHDKAIKIGRSILPFLILKKKQAETILSLAQVAARLQAGEIGSAQASLQAAELKQAIHVLNLKGPKKDSGLGAVPIVGEVQEVQESNS